MNQKKRTKKGVIKNSMQEKELEERRKEAQWLVQKDTLQKLLRPKKKDDGTFYYITEKDCLIARTSQEIADKYIDELNDKIKKDKNIEQEEKIIKKEILIKRSRISPAVLTYWHNAKDEPEWSWDGKILQLLDISDNVLNSEVFKVFCSDENDSSILNPRTHKVENLRINGKPVTISTSASAVPNSETIRRQSIINLTESEEQTDLIMKRHCELAKKGIYPPINKNISVALHKLERYNVSIPFADLIPSHFPKKHVVMRTLLPRFLDFIRASACLHQFQREKDEDGFIIAVGKDYDIARECIETIKSNKYMIPLTITQKKILARFEEDIENGKLKPDCLHGNLVKLQSTFNFLSRHGLETNLGILASYGIIETYNDTDDYNRDIMKYKLNPNYTGSIETKLPSFEEMKNKSVKHKSENDFKAINEDEKGKIKKYIEDTEEENDFLKILKDKNLFDRITLKELDKNIVGEYKARRTIFLCSCGILVKNNQIASFNLLVNDVAGTGKDYVVDNTLKIWKL